MTDRTTPVTKDNHYVSQALLRRWAPDGKRVWTYRTLVSHRHLPLWARHSIRGVAFQRHLYTTMSAGKQSDSFERWIATEFEEPGLDSIEKLLHGRQLTPKDWRAIVRFAALQDIRTPLDFVTSLEEWRRTLPDMIGQTVQNTIERIKEAQKLDRQIEVAPDEEPFPDVFSVRVRPNPDDESLKRIEADVTVGRDLWIGKVRHLLRADGPMSTLVDHRWSIAQPAEGEPGWITSDHPVVRLNFNSLDDYNFGGGWGHVGTEIFMPLSPRHLLYTQVGRKQAPRFSFPKVHTSLIQRFLAERAYRWIFADEPHAWVATVRPREASFEQFSQERRAWKEFQQELESPVASE